MLALWLEEQPWVRAPGLRILHVAPEPVLQRRLRKLPDVTYLSADIASPLADQHFSVTAIPYPAGSFDVVLCNHVLEHVDDDALAMRELHRVLVPGGRAVLMCPIGRNRPQTFEDPTRKTESDRLAAFGQEDHVRLYGNDYYDRLRAAGFTVTVDDVLGRLDEPLVERLRLRQGHEVFEDDVVVLGVATSA